MAKTLDQLAERAALVEAARQFHSRGWMQGTAGNLSARHPSSKANSFWITASGLPKGNLEESDFLRVDINTGQVINQATTDIKPSAETSIHQIIYTKFPQANCCMHVHSIDAALAVARHAAHENYLSLPALEMLKGFGVREENPQVFLPIFPNHADVQTISHDISLHYDINPPQLDALMIRNHGITVWGPTIQATYNRIELIEFILSYLARK